ncbi:ferrochelatase [Teredinibacter sp. KSP-S5-2]|uniref:ferrochelatase n=1 Tax=Teredinibacter sp. KSP-S5-2 TaxID=3034506 RepID=UPI0029341423|nr:ferrochelatase [Teredinibacter sp. KSP-S5-2]WNO09058.1 ferrochelatase [Teredinibacter sp. KSP-S5-2]
MKYRGITTYRHDTPKRIGVLITNLGSPDAPTKQALRTYLKQFLSDPRVIEVPKAIWWFILNGIILNTRPAKSAEAYRQVWTEQGSPLAIYTQKQAHLLAESLHKEYGENICVEWAMRYGNPSIGSALEKLQHDNCDRIVVLPLYPQYAASATASTFDAIAEDFKTRRWLPELRFVQNYHDFPPYIQALSAKIASFWQLHGKPDKLVFSYHGIPLRYFHNGDPYPCQCMKTARLVAEALNLQQDDYLISFQSRFGKEPWVQPYTDETLKQLAKDGTKHVQVVCPGFSSDCLETLEEIGEENKAYFMQAGGETFHYIPALNDDHDHIEMLKNLVGKHLSGWDISINSSEELNAQLTRVKQCPFNQKNQ